MLLKSGCNGFGFNLVKSSQAKCLYFSSDAINCNSFQFIEIIIFGVLFFQDNIQHLIWHECELLDGYFYTIPLGCSEWLNRPNSSTIVLFNNNTQVTFYQ
jgi:hypothetical protein